MAASRPCFKSFNRLSPRVGPHRSHQGPRSRVIITCPNCHTRYKVASDALSAAGRQVQCASCTELWYATPSFPPPAAASDDELAFRADKDSLSDEEDQLDSAFLQEETPTASTPPAPQDEAANIARDAAVARRRNGMMAALPLGRFRRAYRIGVWSILALILVTGVTLRTQIVSAIPQLDGLYRLVGLGTNVVGLDFTEIKTLRTTRDGSSVIIVNAKISNIANHIISVPTVLVSLLSDADTVLYEWTVTPATRNALPGDVLEIETQLNGPPQGVSKVRLSFVERRNSAPADRQG